jgi:hypothetical protein
MNLLLAFARSMLFVWLCLAVLFGLQLSRVVNARSVLVWIGFVLSLLAVLASLVGGTSAHAL